MIDIKLIRENPELVKENIKKKFQDKKLVLVDEVKELDKRVREVQVKVDGLKADKNRLSGEIGKLMKEGKKDEVLTQEMAKLFVEFLKKHNSSTKKIDLNKENYVNRAFVAFYRKWKQEGRVVFPPNCYACYRFLKEDCKLHMEKGINVYANALRKWINETSKSDLLII